MTVSTPNDHHQQLIGIPRKSSHKPDDLPTTSTSPTRATTGEQAIKQDTQIVTSNHRDYVNGEMRLE